MVCLHVVEATLNVTYVQQEPSLQESTASDPLTLEEEYRMQQTWLNDEDSEPPS